MKTIPRQLLFGAALACFGMVTVAVLAEESSPPVAEPTAAAAEPVRAHPDQAGAPTSSSSAVAAPDAAASSSVSTSTTTSTSPAADAATTATGTAPEAGRAEPAPEPAQAEPAASAASPATTATSEMRRIDATAQEPAAAEASTPTAPPAPRRSSRSGTQERVSFFNNVELGPDEVADAVVAIGGNVTSQGEVRDAVVAVFGNVRVTGRVGDSAVAVLGNVFVDSRVGEVVSVMGTVELGPHAEVMGDVVAVGGGVKRHPDAIVHGEMPNVQFAPLNFGGLDWLHAYISQCVAKGRLLAFGPHLGWAWAIAIGFLVFYALLALLFRGGVEKSVMTLETRPGGSILAAVLTLLLTPVLTVLLCITVVGIAVVPFLAIGLFCANLFGKAVMLAWIGRRITKPLGEGPLAHPAVGVLLGGVIVLALYLVPIVGFITYKLLGVLGLGVVVYTLLLASKRKPAPAAAVPVPPAATPAESGFVAADPAVGVAAGTMVAEPAVVAPPVTMSTLPRAGFWIRTAALLIDVILVSLVLVVLSWVFPHGWINVLSGLLPALAIYGAVLWKIRATTIGGIICGLRVVRLDNREIDWATAVVRSLSCFLSLVVAGLGFIWAAIDDDKQSWHDKIAGTTVVFARGTLI